MAVAYIGIGSNLGHPEANIRRAVKMMMEADIMQEVQSSSLYLTEPVGEKKQPDFINLVIKGKTNLGPSGLLDSLLQIEEELGRERKEEWGPRQIDLDILFYDDSIINQENLVLPHREIPNRRFVLVPLVEISPNLIHPISKKNMKQLLEETKDQSKVELYGGIYAGK